MSERPNDNFMDSRTLAAIALVGIVWFGWQTYLAKKYPQTAVPVATKETVESKVSESQVIENTGSKPEASNLILSQQLETKELPEQVLNFDGPLFSFELSSFGMGFNNFTLKENLDRDFQPMKMGHKTSMSSLFALKLIDSNRLIPFAIVKKGSNLFQGTAQIGNLKIIREIEIQNETQAIINRVFVESIDSEFRGLSVLIPEKRMDYSGGNFLIPSFEHQEFTLLHEGTETRINSTASSETINQTFNNVNLASINSQYFSSAILNKSEIIPEAQIIGGEPQDVLNVTLTYRIPPSSKTNYEFEWISYSGAKSMTTLEKIDPTLGKVINHGFFSSIAKLLLVLLKWFHSIVGNWGVSIILLTLLVRVLVLPLNVSTFKSTKKMQKIQPLITELRERYKDDPPTMNKEMMALWKEHKVNPVGGCLPMLLQLPVFFALYQVLGQSIELYQAPFMLWIRDLSLKDPYYILPILMAVAMYVQQKITPTTLDPTQTKIMQFLPLIFALMMITLPAGLTLYILINTVAGILLQQLFMRDPKTTIPAKA